MLGEVRMRAEGRRLVVEVPVREVLAEGGKYSRCDLVASTEGFVAVPGLEGWVASVALGVERREWEPRPVPGDREWYAEQARNVRIRVSTEGGRPLVVLEADLDGPAKQSKRGLGLVATTRGWTEVDDRSCWQHRVMFLLGTAADDYEAQAAERRARLAEMPDFGDRVAFGKARARAAKYGMTVEDYAAYREYRKLRGEDLAEATSRRKRAAWGSVLGKWQSRTAEQRAAAAKKAGETRRRRKAEGWYGKGGRKLQGKALSEAKKQARVRRAEGRAAAVSDEAALAAARAVAEADVEGSGATRHFWR
jgi:hypothetical protein